MDGLEFQQRTERIEQALQCVNAIASDEARTAALDLMQSVMDMHGAVVTRMVEMLSSETGEAGRNTLPKIAADPLICGLLVLYGVHPVPMEERVARAIEKVRLKVRQQSGEVELLGIEEDVVRLSIKSEGHGCHSSPEALKQTVEQAILEAAPEVMEIVAEGVPAAGSGFVALSMLQPVMSEGEQHEESAA